MSSARASPAAPASPHPELAALLLAFADLPVGEGDAALGAPRLVLADWLAEYDDGREGEVRGGVRAEDLVRELIPDDDGALWPDTRRTFRRWRRRLLALFPEVVLRVPCSFCGGSGQATEVSAVRKVGGRMEYDDPRPAQCMACGGSRREGVAAPLLVPEEPPA